MPIAIKAFHDKNSTNNTFEIEGLLCEKNNINQPMLDKLYKYNFDSIKNPDKINKYKNEYDKMFEIFNSG